MKGKNLLLVLVLIFSLGISAIGCSSEKKDETTKEVTENVSNEQNEEVNEEESVSFKLAMHVANVEQFEPATYAIVQEFMKENPNITIEIEGRDTEEHTKTMRANVQADNLPEVFWMLPADAKVMSEGGYLLDLNEFLDLYPEIKNNFLPNTLVSTNESGVQYGLPYQPLVTGFWYNKAILEENNLELPTTYEEFIAIIKALKDKGVTPIAQGTKDNYATWAFQHFYVRYGYYYKIDDILSGNDSFNNEDFVKMYEKIKEMSEIGAFPDNVATMGYFDALQMFERGDAAFLNAGGWLTSQFEESENAKNIGFWWGPTFSDSEYKQEVGMKVPAAPFVVSAKVAEDPELKEAVFKFLAFYYGEKGTQIMVDNQILPPVYYNGKIDEENSPVFAGILNKLNDSWSSPIAQPDLYVPSNVADEMNNSIMGMINGIYTPEEALNRIDDIVKDTIN